MDRLKIHKIIGADPETIEPNSIYLIRTGRGLSIKVSDMTGGTLHSVNSNVDAYDADGFVSDNVRYWVGTVQSVDGVWSCDYSGAGFSRVLSVTPVCLVPNTNSAEDAKYAAVYNDSITVSGCSGTASNAVSAGLLAAVVNTKADCPVQVTVMGIV